MMQDLLESGLAIVAGILGIAILSVIVGKNSKAPAAIAATGNALAGVVSAAVNPLPAGSIASNNPSNVGNLGSSAFSSSFPNISSSLNLPSTLL